MRGFLRARTERWRERVAGEKHQWIVPAQLPHAAHEARGAADGLVLGLWQRRWSARGLYEVARGPTRAPAPSTLYTSLKCKIVRPFALRCRAVRSRDGAEVMRGRACTSRTGAGLLASSRCSPRPSAASAGHRVSRCRPGPGRRAARASCSTSAKKAAASSGRSASALSASSRKRSSRPCL